MKEIEMELENFANQYIIAWCNNETERKKLLVKAYAKTLLYMIISGTTRSL